MVNVPRMKLFGKPKKRDERTGLPPGTPVYLGEKRDEKVRITLMNYDKDGLIEKEIVDVKECLEHIRSLRVTWVNVAGIHDTEIVKRVCEVFNLHPLIQGDVVNFEQRPKAEDYGNHIFVTMKMLDIYEGAKEIRSEHISLILGPNFLLTFQEMEGD